MTDKIVVFSTCDTAAQAGTIAGTLVEKGLAACVNIVGPVRSLYRWKGEIEDASEYLLIIKSREGLLDQLTHTLQGIHSYETPEVIALPVAGGAEAYLQWLTASLKPASDAPR